MGNAFNSQCTLTEAEIANYAKQTVFTPDEIRALWVHFKTINASHEYITRKQFQAAMLFKDSALLDRIFRVFDADDDEQICFIEYLSCLSTLSNKAPKEDKLKFSFQIYDFDGDSFISVSDLTAVIAATLREHKLFILRSDIDQIVKSTMEEVNPKHPNMISFEEYKRLVGNKPLMISQFTINISNIIAEYTRNNVIALTTPRGFASALYLHDHKIAATPRADPKA